MSHILYCKSEEVSKIAVDIQEVLPGIESGTLFQDEPGGILIKQTRIAPNRVVPGHKAAGTVAYQVLEGSGTINIEDEAGNVVSKAFVTAGELMLCEKPHNVRSYVAGENGLVYTLFAFSFNK